MKKVSLFFVLLIIISVGICNNLQKDSFYNYFKNYESVEFCYVLNKGDFENKNINKSVLVSKIVKNGAKNHIYFRKLNNNIHINAAYKQVSLDKSTMQIKRIITDFKININKKEKVENNICLYGYSSMFKKFCILNNYKINFQIVISTNKIIVGYPLIYGSF